MPGTIVAQTTLNFTDLTGAKTGCTTLGSNKFWKGWVEDIGGGAGNYQCQWGSTGTAGSTNGSKLGISLSAALKKFESKKRGKLKKGYTELEVRTDAEENTKRAAKGIVDKPTKKAKGKGKAAPTRKFHPEVGALLGTIYGSTAATVQRGLSANAGSTAENPIGNLSDRQLDIGGGVLDEVESELIAAFGRESLANKDSELPLNTTGVPTARIISLTNDFMSNVPREIDRGMRGKRNLHRLVISSFERLERQRKFLQLLRDAHVAKAVFAAAAAVSTSTGKEAVWYDGLSCDIEHMAPASAAYKEVARIFNTAQSKRNANWWSSGKSRLRLKRVYKFTRTGTEAAFDKFAAKVTAKPGATGRIMAWHGTRTPNLLGIGKSGLLMPENLPRGVHISGKAFGSGIYHAPAWNATSTAKVGVHATDGTNGALKSMNYTGARGAYYGAGSSSTAFMFLQEVALGIPQVCHHAVWDQKRPTGFPKTDWIYANAGGCATLTHDEVVTFSQDAQIFRYLCEIEVVR